MESAQTDWTKLTVAQLKGALARRALSGDGTKDELVKRLKEYDESAVANSSTMDVDEEKKEEIEPMLLRQALNKGYDAVFALKTVIINPFRPDMMQDPGFVSWLDECYKYTIKKCGSGISAVELVFSTIDKGDAALADLKTNLSGDGIEIRHPKLHRETISPSFLDKREFECLTNDKPEDDFWTRLIILENLPTNLNTEEKLTEFFPEALNVISYQFDPASRGIAILEFRTVEEVNNYLGSVGKKVTIEDQDILVERYNTRSDKWQKNQKMMRNKANKRQKGEEKKSLTDEERVVLNKEVLSINLELDNLQDSEDIFGQEKISKYSELVKNGQVIVLYTCCLFHIAGAHIVLLKDIAKIKLPPRDFPFLKKLAELKRVMNRDTSRRVQQGELTMPEPEDEMIESTRRQINMKKDKANDEDSEFRMKKLTEMDKKLITADKEFKRLRNAIKTMEGHLTPSQKASRASSDKLSSVLTNREQSLSQSFGGRNAARKNQQEALLKKAQMQSKARNQQATANLMKGDPRGGANISGRGGRDNRGKGRNNNRGGRPGTAPTPLMGNRNTQKRPGRQNSFSDRDQPPQKKQQMNRRPFGRQDHGYGGDSRGSYRDGGNYYDRETTDRPDRSMKLIEGITSALTDKMMQLEQMQQQTLQTQAQLLTTNQGYGGTGTGYSNQPMSGATSMSMTGSMYGNKSTYDSTGYGTEASSYSGMGSGYGDGTTYDYNSGYGSTDNRNKSFGYKSGGSKKY